MITFKTLYWIVSTYLYLNSIVSNNSFDDSFLPLSKINLHKLVGGYNKSKNVATFTSRFRVRTLIYILSWIIWFLIF